MKINVKLISCESNLKLKWIKSNVIIKRIKSLRSRVRKFVV